MVTISKAHDKDLTDVESLLARRLIRKRNLRNEQRKPAPPAPVWFLKNEEFKLRAVNYQTKRYVAALAIDVCRIF